MVLDVIPSNLRRLLAFSHMIEKVPLFHRAAYRLCQAYSYAPLVHNPNCDLIVGSKQAVPATKSCIVRGLDTGSCAESANGKNYCYLFPVE